MEGSGSVALSPRNGRPVSRLSFPARSGLVVVEALFDLRCADRGALDRVSHIILGRRVPSQTTSLFALRDRLAAAEDAVVDVTVDDRACLNRQMCPDCLRNPALDL